MRIGKNFKNFLMKEDFIFSSSNLHIKNKNSSSKSIEEYSSEVF